MEHTSNYELSKWAERDRILMEDFNMDHDKIDAALALANSDRVYLGSYVGDATENRKIDLPFTPQFVILIGFINGSGALTIATAETDRYVTSSSCGGGGGKAALVVENGIQLGASSATWHNTKDRIEYYIAVR